MKYSWVWSSIFNSTNTIRALLLYCCLRPLLTNLSCIKSKSQMCFFFFFITTNDMLFCPYSMANFLICSVHLPEGIETMSSWHFLVVSLEMLSKLNFIQLDTSVKIARDNFLILLMLVQYTYMYLIHKKYNKEIKILLLLLWSIQQKKQSTINQQEQRKHYYYILF